MTARRILISKCALIGAVPIMMFGFSTGPPIKRTGAAVDGGLACVACHRSFPLNSGAGSVKITAAPYTPGTKQNVTVTVADPQAQRWGFELTARPISDETKMAGSFTPVDNQIRVACDPTGLAPCNGALEFATHLAPATLPGTTGSRTFTIEWTPPATNVGPVIFYAAGNAADNSSTFFGDYIYTTRLTILPTAGVPKPAITQNGVLNGASFTAAISQNGWVTIKGTGLSFSTRTWRDDDFIGGKLPKSLDGVSVKVNGKDAYVYYVSPTQINALAPVDTTEGPVMVQVTNNGSASDAQASQLLKYAPAFFLIGGNNIAATHSDNSLIGPATLFPNQSTPAKPGETIVLYGTGFGQTNPAIPDGELVTKSAPLAIVPTVTVGGTAVVPAFAGLSAAGLYQFNLTVPATAADGDVAVVVTIGGVSSPATAVIRVQR